MTKKTIIIGSIAVVVVGVCSLLFFPKSSNNTNISWVTTTPTTQNISQSVTATGTIEPVTLVDVGTQVSGILTSLYVDYNSEVTKGQVIAELDKSTLLLDRNSNRNNVAVAQSKYDYELKNYTRIKTLFERGLISDNEYESTLYSYESAKNALAIAKNDLQRSETNLGYATIYSPIDGVILSRSVEEGQTVASSFSTPTLFTVAADLKDMRVIVDVDEADIGNVVEGLKATFSVDAFPLDTFEGVVTQVRQEAIIESNVVTYEVVISAANPDLKLKPGLTANVEIFTMDIECDKVVSSAALTFVPPTSMMGEMPQRPSGGMGERPEGAPMGERPEGAPMGGSSSERTIVWVLNGENIEPRPVKVGVSNGILTQIDGVDKSTQIVIGMEQKSTASTSSSSAASSPFVQKRPGQK